MTDKIAEIRARHSAKAKIDPSGGYRIDGYSYPETLVQTQHDLATLLAEVERLRAEIERQARHIEELRQKIDAERSCACSFDAPGDVCAAHSLALAEAQAEIERLKQEPERLRAELISLTNAARKALADAYDRGRNALEGKP